MCILLICTYTNILSPLRVPGRRKMPLAMSIPSMQSMFKIAFPWGPWRNAWFQSWGRKVQDKPGTSWYARKQGVQRMMMA